MTLLFWVSLTTLLYIYIGYPGLIWVFARCCGREPIRRDITPTVSVLLPVYNEADHIGQKLQNTLALEYPKDRLEIVVASDGSTDSTNAIVKRFEGQGVTLLAMQDHLGKSAILSRTVPLLRGDLIVFSDATSELEPRALRTLVRNFADPMVGCASGPYRLQASTDLRAQGEGLYWWYEMFIRSRESRLHSTMGSHGPCYAIRKQLFQRLEPTLINDDFLIPMRIVAQGYRAIHDPDAVILERDLVSVKGEFARRRRIAAGNCQQLIELRHLLNPAYGWVAFCFFSHKVLRTIAPLLLVLLLITSLWLPLPWAVGLIGLQSAFYASAFAGYVSHRIGCPLRWLSPPFYFCLGNLAMLAGLLRYSFSRRRFTWDRAR